MREETEQEKENAAAASQLRKLTKEEIKSALKTHMQWVNSNGREGRSADFCKAHLKGEVLMGANLMGADFREAYLYGAYLKKANLEDAGLRGANLRGANLRWANLKQADLKNANLVRADLHAANLEQADLRGANLKMAEGLTQEQIALAKIDAATVLPDYLKKN